MVQQSVISRWQSELDRLRLAETFSSEEARTNTLVFPVSEAIGSGVTDTETHKFLQTCWRQYSKTAANAGMVGLFYCWFDEMSATIRVSFSSGLTLQELPFGCKVHALSGMWSIAQQAIGAAYTNGIPFNEFCDVDDNDWGDIEDDLPFVQEVYVRRVSTTPDNTADIAP